MKIMSNIIARALFTFFEPWVNNNCTPPPPPKKLVCFSLFGYSYIFMKIFLKTQNTMMHYFNVKMYHNIQLYTIKKNYKN